MNAQAEKALIEKLKALSPERRAEVEDFVDFLKARDERIRDEAARRLGEAFERLDALDTSPLTGEEVEAEIEATSVRLSRDHAVRSDHRAFATLSGCHRRT